MPNVWPCTCCGSQKSKSQSFAEALLAARSQVGQCQTCFHLSAEPSCEICRNPERSTGMICVVADSRDLLALEAPVNTAVAITCLAA